MKMRKRILSAVSALAMVGAAIPATVFADTITVPELNVETKGIPDLECFQFTASMGAGFNLGNTFDAVDTNAPANSANTYLESAWVSTATSEATIDAVKAAGFDTIRIPVSWHNHLDSNWKIYDEWMDRVQTIVDYAVENDMYIILNIHHDNETAYMYPDYAHLDNSMNYVSTIWAQIAERFANYDEHLIFETMNEPRLVGSTYEWWYTSSASECVEAADCINQLNQKSLDTIRAAGGNNATRYVMVPAYAAKPEAAIANEFKLPTDTVENRIMISTHAYIPYNFAMLAASESASTTELTDADKTEILNQMETLYIKFISKNIPVVMGEFGARNKNDNTQARTDYAAYYSAYARSRGITCCWWDNELTNTYAGEAFGLLDRKTSAWNYPTIVEALVKYGSGKDSTFIPPANEDIDDENKLAGDVFPDGTIAFPQAVGDKVVLDIELAANCGFANGCLAFTVPVNGVSYWTSFQWSTSSSDSVVIDLTTPFNVINCDTGEAETDEALFAAIVKAVSASSSASYQYWWASDLEGEELSTPSDYATITGAAIVLAGTEEEETTTTTETTTTETTTETTTTTTTTVPEVTVIVGDMNEDKSVDIVDIVMLARYVAQDSEISVSGNGLIAADVNSDGQIDASDINALCQYISGI